MIPFKFILIVATICNFPKFALMFHTISENTADMDTEVDTLINTIEQPDDIKEGSDIQLHK